MIPRPTERKAGRLPWHPGIADDSPRHVLFFTRGLGIGHATRDVAILNELSEQCPQVRVTIASYARGLPLLRSFGFRPIDLGLPPIGANNERLLRIADLIRRLQPDLVVSDEELLALPIAKLAGIPSVLVTNWLIEEHHFLDATFMRSADEIIIPDLPDSFQQPGGLDVATSYVGPIIRPFRHFPGEREELRSELGMPKGAMTLCAIAAGSIPGDREFLETCVAMVDLLKQDVLLIVLAGELKAEMEALARSDRRLRIHDFAFDLDALMVASDLVICRGGHNTLWELAALGLPSISIPPKRANNPMADVYARNMAQRGTTIIIDEDELTPQKLAEAVTALVETELGNRLANRGRQLTQKRGDAEAVAKILRNLPSRSPLR